MRNNPAERRNYFKLTHYRIANGTQKGRATTRQPTLPQDGIFAVAVKEEACVPRSTDKLVETLAQIMPPDHVGQWLRTPNPAFEGQPPIQVIERGESDRLWRMIFQIDAGVAG
jgi:hypothetical protein